MAANSLFLAGVALRRHWTADDEVNVAMSRFCRCAVHLRVIPQSCGFCLQHAGLPPVGEAKRDDERCNVCPSCHPWVKLRVVRIPTCMPSVSEPISEHRDRLVVFSPVDRSPPMNLLGRITYLRMIMKLQRFRKFKIGSGFLTHQKNPPSDLDRHMVGYDLPL